MSTTMTTSWKIGDKVRPHPHAGWRGVDPSRVYTIVNVPSGARTRYEAKPDDGGSGLRGPADAFIAADAPDPQLPAVHPGSFIKTRIQGREQTVVVIRVTGDTCSATLPGGDNGRYWRGVRLTSARLIDPAAVTIAE